VEDPNALLKPIQLDPDAKSTTIEKETNEAAVRMLLAAATLASSQQPRSTNGVGSHADSKKSQAERMADELDSVFPLLETKFISAVIESEEAVLSRALFERLHDQEEKLKQEQLQQQPKRPQSAWFKQEEQKTGGSAKAETSSTVQVQPQPQTTAKEVAGNDDKSNEDDKVESSKKKKAKKKKKKKKQQPSPAPAVSIGGRPVLTIGKNMKLEGPNTITSETVLSILPLRPVKNMSVEAVSPSGRVRESVCTFSSGEFGTHVIRVTCDSKKADDYRIIVLTPVYRYAASLDRLYDQLFWSWEGNWHAELESTTVTLVLAVEDNLKKFIEGMESMLKAFGQGTDTAQLLTTLQENMGNALQDHDETALGRLHQAIYQFLEVGMMPWPASFKDAVANFEQVKFKYSNQDKVKDALVLVHSALRAHVAQAKVERKALAPNDAYMQRLDKFEQRMGAMLAKGQVDLSLMWELRPKPFERMFSMFGGGSGSQAGGDAKGALKTTKISYLPSLELEEVAAGGQALEHKVSLYNETLLGDALMVGSLLGYEVGFDIERDRKMIQNLLMAGFGYLTSKGGKIIPTLNSVRAVLPLPERISSSSSSSTATEAKDSGQKRKKGSGAAAGPLDAWKCKYVHRKLKKRAKDVARVVRNQPRHKGKLSVRLNTDFKQTMSLLKSHHKDSWVGEKLQRVWEIMWEQKEMVVFELWYGEEMIAADIAHCVGRSFYVATRFFAKEHRKFQPGFLLALVETKVLADAGFALWDLGGTDSSPMMSYKEVVAHEMSRPEFLEHFRRVRLGEAKLKSGTLIEDVTVDHLLLT